MAVVDLSRPQIESSTKAKFSFAFAEKMTRVRRIVSGCNTLPMAMYSKNIVYFCIRGALAANISPSHLERWQNNSSPLEIPRWRSKSLFLNPKGCVFLFWPELP
jgi:hypothetical protein